MKGVFEGYRETRYPFLFLLIFEILGDIGRLVT